MSMGRNNPIKRKEIKPGPRPRRIVEPLGIGTFVTLDYGVNVQSRNEYAVMLLSDNWASLRDLLYDPQAFVDAWRQRYTWTPTMTFESGTSTKSMPDWKLVGPITIQIEPLTVPTPSNLLLLSGLTSMYPELKTVIAAGALGNQDFAAKLTKALVPAAPSAPRVRRSNPMNLAPMRAANPVTLDSCTTEPPPKPLAYIVEFAVLTRIMTIKYVPQPETSPRWFEAIGTFEQQRGNPSAKTKDDFTGINLNNVAGTDLTFMHFDIAFDELVRPHTHDDVSRRRADFVMSYLEKFDFFMAMKRPSDVATLATLKPDDNNHVLDQPGYTNPYPITKLKMIGNQRGPSVTIDSVYSPTDPQLQKVAPPFICVLGVTVPVTDANGNVIYDSNGNVNEWTTNGVIVKSYQAPA